MKRFAAKLVRYVQKLWVPCAVGLLYAGLTDLALDFGVKYPAKLFPHSKPSWWITGAAVMFVMPALRGGILTIRAKSLQVPALGWFILVLGVCLVPWPWFQELVSRYELLRFTPGVLGILGYFLTTLTPNLPVQPRERTWDDTKLTLGEDRLGRAGLAKLVAEVILSNVEPRPTRVGIFGPWGSGKSTFLEFLKQCLEDGATRVEKATVVGEDSVKHKVWLTDEVLVAGEPSVPDKVSVVMFNPWHYTSRDKVWHALIEVLEEALIQQAGEWSRVDLNVKRWFKSLVQVVRTGWKAKTEVGQKMADLLLDQAEGVFDDRKAGLSAAVSTYLRSGRRIVVLIDDLDRVDPQIAVEMLSCIKEFLDLPHITYVIAVDVDALSLAIDGVHQGLGPDGGRRYLEKIIHWPVNLPEKAQLDWNSEPDLVNAINSLDSSALSAISGHFPANPRQLKRFIWGLAVQFPEKSVGSDLNRKILYLAKLLDVLFPSVLRRIVDNESLSGALSFAGRLLTAGTEDDRKQQFKRWNELLFSDMPGVDEPTKDRVWQLFLAMYEHATDSSRIELGLALHGSQETPLSALFTPVIDSWTRTSPGNRVEKLRSLLVDMPVSIDEAWRGLFEHIIEQRNVRSGEMIDTATEEVILKEREYILNLGELLFDLLSVAASQLTPTACITAQTFNALYNSCSKYAHFVKPVYYLEIRAQEQRLLHRAVSLVECEPESYLHLFQPYLYEPDGLQEKAARVLMDQVVDRLITRRVDDILALFTVKEGILPRITDQKFGWDRMLLLDENRWFHSAGTRRRLYSLLESSSSDPVIRENLYHYFSYLCGDTIRSSMVEDRAFIMKLWKYLVSGPLNYRHIGSLLDHKRNVERIWKTGRVLPVPSDPLWRDR